jgi:hypothetical protein
LHSKRRVQDAVDIRPEPGRIDVRKSMPPLEEQARRQWAAGRGSQFGDRLAVTGDGHDLAGGDAVEDLAPAVAQVSNCNFGHVGSVFTSETHGRAAGGLGSAAIDVRMALYAVIAADAVVSAAALVGMMDRCAFRSSSRGRWYR